MAGEAIRWSFIYHTKITLQFYNVVISLFLSLIGENPWKEVSKSDLTVISFPRGFCGECGDFPDVKITFFFALNPSKKMCLQVMNLAVENDSWLHYNRNFRQRKKHLL